MAEQPTVMVAVYGKPKNRKTSDCLAAFPNALCIGVPSALTLVAQNELGFTPAVHPSPPQTLAELVDLLYSVSISDHNYGAVVIDDASHICKRSMLAWEEAAPVGRSGKKDRFWAYQQLNRYLLQLAGISRHLGTHLVMNFHERSSGTDSMGNFTPGGPEVPSRNQTEMLPSWCDLALRATIDPTYPDPWFPSVYFCDPTDPDWVTGDRTGVCSRRTPGNLREILRASHSNYRLDRIPGLEWQDDVADAVVDAMTAGLNSKEAVTKVAGLHDYDPRHLRWACQDGIARYVLSLSKSKSFFDFDSDVVSEPSNQGGPALPPPPPSK